MNPAAAAGGGRLFPHARLLKTVGAALLLWLLAPQAGRAGVIDNVEIDDRQSPPTVRINLAVPLQYIGHAPENHGDELQIQVRSVAGNRFTRDAEHSDSQSVTAPASPLVPLTDAGYRSTTGIAPGIDDSRVASEQRGVLTLRFSREVGWQVRPGADRRHITVSVAPAAGPPADTKVRRPPKNPVEHYVVNLESYLEEGERPSLRGKVKNAGLSVYTTRFPVEGRVWHRLRVGFFATRQEAEAFRKTIADQYPEAWVAYAGGAEIEAALQQSGGVPTASPVPREAQDDGLPAASGEKLDRLMEQARRAIAQNNISHAIQLYTKVLRYPQNPYSRDALEFLGLARERNRQYAHAIREYERYLERYPEGEGSERVRQRLAGLLTIDDRPRTLSGVKRRTAKATPWDIYGGFSQYYRRDESRTDAGGDVVTQSSLATDLDVTARKRSANYDLQSRFTGAYFHDFLDEDTGNDTSISSLYIDGSQKQYGLSTRLGRQSRNSGGVLGRFDGLLVGYQVSERLTVNGVAGFPVWSTRDSLETGRYLYGISADLGTFANTWDFETFFIEQQNDGILDRRAIGGEARYFDPSRSLLTFVDYDVSYTSLNTLIVLGAWTLPDRTTFNASFDYRNSPVLTTSNALIGQTLPDLDDLVDTLGEDQVRQLAEDRTAELTTVTLGATHPFNDKLQLSGDVTASSLSGTDASGGIAAVPGSGNEYYYGLQLIGSDLFSTGDISVAGVRYANTGSGETASLSCDVRFPVNNAWRINPRLRVDHRQNDNIDSTQWTGAPSLRVDYRWRRRYRFELEAGGEWSNEELPDDSQDSSAWFFSAGYRVDF